MIGGDVRSLTWIWGRIGGQQTEEQLDTLGPEWRVEHDNDAVGGPQRR